MTKNTPDVDSVRDMKRITEEELWDVMDTGRENVQNTRVADDVTTCDKIEYSSHKLAEFLDW